jgi:recombination protein RecR
VALIPSSLQILVQEFSKLPGVGERSALRYALALLRSGRNAPLDLARALQEVSENVDSCPTCHFWTQESRCPLCNNPQLDSDTLCIVRDSPDVLALERFRTHGWRYHVLQGLLSPLQGMGPQKLKLSTLFSRIESEGVKELILALDATLEGDATALYIRDYVQEHFPQVKLSRTALGLPAGSSVEYLDPSTLEQALLHRTGI